MHDMAAQHSIQIYQTEDGQTRMDVRFDRDTLWLAQSQMAELFDKDSDTISLHLRKIYDSGELDQQATTEESSVVRQEGKRQVRRSIRFYNLDVVISVGYRVSSKKGTLFRIWATQRLRAYLIQGYTLNQARFEQNAAELEQALALIHRAAHSPAITSEVGSGLVEIVSRYTQTFLLLQRYDEGMLTEPAGQRGGRLPKEGEAMAALKALKIRVIGQHQLRGPQAKRGLLRNEANRD